jgi:hypothetical protein
VTIKDLKIAQGVTIEANDGTEGSFRGSSAQDLKALREHLPKIRKLLVGKNPLDPTLAGELLWETIFPGKAQLLLKAGKCPWHSHLRHLEHHVPGESTGPMA